MDNYAWHADMPECTDMRAARDRAALCICEECAATGCATCERPSNGHDMLGMPQCHACWQANAREVIA